MVSRPRSRPARPELARRSMLAFGGLIALGLGLTGLAVPTPAAAETPIGAVEAVQGDAFARKADSTRQRPLDVGAPVHLGEVLSTGPNGRLHVALERGGSLQLGADAAFVVDRMALGEAPSAAESTVMRLFSGPFRLAGAHEGTEVRTHLAVLGVRGTDFWGGDIDGGFGVLVQEGVVEVMTGTDSVTLDQPGQGVMLNVTGTGTDPGTEPSPSPTPSPSPEPVYRPLSGPGVGALPGIAALVRPGPVKTWPSDKAARAFESVALTSP